MAQIKIDPESLREWEESRPESRKELAESIGRTTSVFSNAYARGEMNEVVLSFLCKTFGLPEDAFLPKEKTVVVLGGGINLPSDAICTSGQAAAGCLLRRGGDGVRMGKDLRRHGVGSDQVHQLRGAHVL